MKNEEATGFRFRTLGLNVALLLAGHGYVTASPRFIFLCCKVGIWTTYLGVVVQDECGNAHTEWYAGAMKLSTKTVSPLQAGPMHSFRHSGAHRNTWSGKAALNRMDETKREK